MAKLICPGCYEEITDMVGTTATVMEGVDGHVVYHAKCDPIQQIINAPKEEKSNG